MSMDWQDLQRLQATIAEAIASGMEARSHNRLRQDIAAMVMQGLLANGELLRQHGLPTERTARDAVEFADALIAELNKAQP